MLNIVLAVGHQFQPGILNTNAVGVYFAVCFYREQNRFIRAYSYRKSACGIYHRLNDSFKNIVSCNELS